MKMPLRVPACFYREYVKKRKRSSMARNITKDMPQRMLSFFSCRWYVSQLSLASTRMSIPLRRRKTSRKSCMSIQIIEAQNRIICSMPPGASNEIPKRNNPALIIPRRSIFFENQMSFLRFLLSACALTVLSFLWCSNENKLPVPSDK